VRYLDGDETLQLLVIGQIDDAEAAFAQDPLDIVTADSPGLFTRCDSDGEDFQIVRLARLCSFRVGRG
jgi:hypothetical protein